MRILVVGSGGREHALVWKLAQSPSVRQIFCAPGNPGIGALAELVPVAADNLHGLVHFAKEHRIDLTVVGPEQPLAEGIADLFAENGLRVFGPTKRAARLEWSKAFAKDFMRRHSIPTASYEVFRRDDFASLENCLKQSRFPLVLKADGLAAGKGVLVCRDLAEALKGARDICTTSLFGTAGDSVVVEEFLAGTEASVFAVTDGEEYFTLPPAQDYKRAFDGDLGKNTGGMGAYAPTPMIDDAILDEVCHEIIEPTLDGMRREGSPYSGCLYVGLMLTSSGPRVVEYNSRFGDPETQVVLPLLHGDFAHLLYSASTGGLGEWKSRRLADPVTDESAVCVILASGGYPDQYEKGKEISGLDALRDRRGLVAFHAGTAQSGDKVVTSGGRVLGIVSYGKGGVELMRERVYEVLPLLTFDRMHYRTDIGRILETPGLPRHS
jgi:phosphoribosylamine--glycine ligase